MKHLILFVAATCAAPASTFLLPNPTYLGATTPVNFADPDEAMLNSITDGSLTIAFSTPMRASTVGDNWSTWGVPPNTQSATPRVLWSGVDDNFDPITTVTFSFNLPLSIFGFEAEPGPTDTHTLTANFFLGGQLQQTLSLDVDGNGGALLFAAAGAGFDSVTVSSDADFAAGQFRYAPLVTPEPHPWGLIPGGMALLLVISRKLNRQFPGGLS